MEFKLYEVGGKIRDEFLGLPSKDVDYSVVAEGTSITSTSLIFESLIVYLEQEGYQIFQVTNEAFTIRAKFPDNHQHSGVADFVLARKEIGYNAMSRMPEVAVGTLHDDLLRRDFTVNAMAKDEDGNIIDPFHGQIDLAHGMLRTPSDAGMAFHNDPLRIMRALRFKITKGFSLSDEIVDAISLFDPVTFMIKVSEERTREELTKMFKHSTPQTLETLFWLRKVNPALYNVIFQGDMWLMPTTKK